jgi:transketolase
MSTFDPVDQLAANTLRMLAADAVQKANSGHPGLPMGAADVAYVLWTRFLKHNPTDPQWPDRDRFVLSAGHGSMLLYGLLHLTGYNLPLEELKQFRQWGSKTPGHPEYGHTPGVETTTGPLGQGLGNAVGMALAERWLAARFNQPDQMVVDHFTYVLVGDGDLMEGISHESASLAGHLGLGRLIVLYDDNGITIDGSTALSCSDDAAMRFEAYGWHTRRIDGHNMAEIEQAIHAAREVEDRPSLILCKTHIGWGSPNKQDSHQAHGEPLGADELRLTKEKLGWPLEPDFYIPPEALDRFRAAVEKGRTAQADWQSRYEVFKSAHPEQSAQFETLLPADWEKALPVFSEADGGVATRAASGKVINALAGVLPAFLGGSADLTPSNKTDLKNAAPLKKGDYSGRYIHFGIREHGMAAALNGLALHGGVIPYGGTFLVFADYNRPSIRLAALMGIGTIFVFTHDSIGVGEDGPTHQPVEHLAALRAIPNLLVIRPADGNETSAAWRVAIKNRNRPSALLLTRQNLPQLAPPDNQLAQGGYILAEADGDQPDLILLASGSEVSLAMQARTALAGEGIKARVVSMPCWELFDEQPDSYRASVILSGVPCLAIEMGTAQGWHKYVGSKGDVISIERFGASAPAGVVMEKLGFTVENVIKRAKGLLR